MEQVKELGGPEAKPHRSENDFLPDEPLEVGSRNPKLLIIYSSPKTGKTSSLAKLDSCLILDIEDGSNHVKALKQKCVMLRKPAGESEQDRLERHARKEYSLEEVVAGLSKYKKQHGKNKYKRLALDSLTKFDEWMELDGTLTYMATTQGKKFNRNPETGKEYKPGQKEFEMVTTLGEGHGYRWPREAMLKWIDFLQTLCDELILVAHVKDKFVASKTGDLVSSKDIDLSGKLKTIIPSRADGIGYMYREKDRLMISFATTEDKICGSRCEHLRGKIIELDWSQIYID